MMIKSYLKIAYRKLLRRKTFTFINMVGLAVSFSTVLLIFLYVQHELSYDTFHSKADRIYRVILHTADPGTAVEQAPDTPRPLAQMVKQQVPGVAQAVRVAQTSGKSAVLRTDTEAYNEDLVFIADSGFFAVFSAEALAGNLATALLQPRSVVLSASTARKYFKNPLESVGKTLWITPSDKEEMHQVTAVVEDFPVNSHFQFHALLSRDYANEEYYPSSWLAHWPTTYLLLDEESDPQQIEARMIALTDSLLDPIYEQRFNKSYQAAKANGELQEYHLQPLEDVHLHSGHMDTDISHGNIRNVYILVVIGLLLLFIAAFNYINLTTAQSTQQAKSTGIRKVLGAVRTQLYSLFLVESVLLCLLAALTALALVQILLSLDSGWVKSFVPTGITLPSVGLLLLLALLLGLLSGLVPAQILSSFKPTQVLKGQLTRGAKGVRLRQILVVTQFTVSSGLIICVLLVGQQLSFLRNKSLGFDKEHLLMIKNVDKLGDKQQTLKQMVSNNASTVRASLAYNDLGEPHNFQAFTPVELIDRGQTESVGIPLYLGDADYLHTVGINLLMGHNFSPNLTEENQQILLNQEALRAFDWQDRSEQELIGKMIDVNGTRYELAGIIQDIHFRSLKYKIEPMAIMSHSYREYENLVIRLKAGSAADAIKELQAEWQQIAPQLPFVYTFVDDQIDALYASERRMATLFQILTGLAIGVACLGLLGLAMFTAERRTKEIGVRKVLGASVSSIVALLSVNIVKLVSISLVLAIPITWYLMQRWLESYEYRITIGWGVFALAGGMVLLIALITISFQTIRAALANPADALRNE